MMRISEAASVLDGRVEGEDVLFAHVSTDTRTVKVGDLFVALRGERYDGHRFVGSAANSGAAAALIDEAQAHDVEHTLPLVAVDDTRLALGRLAAHWRSRFALRLVALTGSSGKTTVKEMIASILREALAASDAPEGMREEVLATRGNLNNDVGVPLMLLELEPAHRYAVIEMGMNHAGEISYLTRLAAPDVALVTNAGRAHIEFLGTEEAIARAKGEIFEGLGADGTVVINGDDRFAPLWRTLAGSRRRIEFGIDHPAEVTATFRLAGFDTEIVLKTPAGEASLRLPAPGVHNVRNALAAAACAIALDVPLAVIAAGLERFAGIKGRLQRKTGRQGAVVIDDTYNANPESARAAIDVLAEAPGTRLFIFGDMGELGSEAPRLHGAIGAHAKAAGIERLFTLGAHAIAACEAFGAGARHFDRIEDLLAELDGTVSSNMTVLVKGSRFMRMERVVDALVQHAEAAGERREEKQR
jgi:UDP-N-acetylmuramoyl-tripeptide--D-alanyl-D-alanine ligase